MARNTAESQRIEYVRTRIAHQSRKRRIALLPHLLNTPGISSASIDLHEGSLPGEIETLEHLVALHATAGGPFAP